MKNVQTTLLILHGWQDSKESWQKVKKEIERQGIKVFVPDLPGFKQENTIEKPWDLDNYVEWVLGFTEKNIEGRFILAGHSFGGRVAIKIAAQCSKKLYGFILISAAGVTPRPKIKIHLFWIFAKIGNLIFSLPILKFLRPLARKIVYFLIGIKDYKIIQYQALKETFKKVINEDLTSLLSKIKVSTLIIWGEKDKTTPLTDAYLMYEKIENSQLEILKNIKHVPHLENPKLLAQKIINFINQTL